MMRFGFAVQWCVVARLRGWPWGGDGSRVPAHPCRTLIGRAALGILVVGSAPAPVLAQLSLPAAPAPSAVGGGSDDKTTEGDEETVKPGVADAATTGNLPPHTTELAKKAATAVSKKDWSTAAELYREMVKTEPDNPLALSNLGAVQFQLGQRDAARLHLDKAVRLNPRLARSWVSLGLIHMEDDEPLLAVSALTRAIHEDADNPAAHNYLAVAAKSLGWINAAELQLQRAIDLDPKYAEAHFNLALVYLERNPPAVELARRHYLHAKDLGSPPDALVEEQIGARKGESDAEASAAAAAPSPSR